jgi:hypothetical protein
VDLLVPEYLAAASEDPFDGKPLRYKRLDRGYAVYSVGDDCKDDGGKPQPPASERAADETSDVVFRVQR